MTVAELIALLQTLPADLPVWKKWNTSDNSGVEPFEDRPYVTEASIGYGSDRREDTGVIVTSYYVDCIDE